MSTPTSLQLPADIPDRVPLTINGGPAIIHLTKCRYALVDVEQWDRVRRFRWCASESTPGLTYAKTADPLEPQKKLYLHRLVLNAPQAYHVDHRNGRTLDCRLANLRLCSAQQNGANSRSRGGSSRFKGVMGPTKHGVWLARICVEYRSRHLGSFRTEEAAALAYDDAARAAWGPFARCNFPARAHLRGRRPGEVR
jgi:hypothetical protein